MLQLATRARQSASVLLNGWRLYVLTFSSKARQSAYIRFWRQRAARPQRSRARLVLAEPAQTASQREPGNVSK